MAPVWLVDCRAPPSPWSMRDLGERALEWKPLLPMPEGHHMLEFQDAT